MREHDWPSGGSGPPPENQAGTSEWGQGTTAAPPAPPPSVPPRPGGGPPAWSAIAAGWGRAAEWAVLTALVTGVLAEGALYLAYFGTKAGQRPSAILLARLGGVVFYAFHHVGMVLDVSRINVPAVITLGASARITLALALMTGTVLVVALLYLGGRSVARSVGGPSWLRGVHGAKVAVPYAAICLLSTLGVRFPTSRLPAGVGGGSIHVHPSYLAALLWPLALGVVFGYAGGYRRSSEAASWETGRTARWIRGAIAGGWRMLFWGLLFGFVSLLGMAATHPHLTRAYFDGAFRGGTLSGLALVYLNSLVIPNMAAWVLFPAMGTCVGVTGSAISVCALSYTHFPSLGQAGPSVPGFGGLPFPQFPAPSAVYYAFVAIPVVAVLLGGRAAAKRSDAGTRAEAVSVGALAGVAFALFALGTLVLADVELKVRGSVGAISQLVEARIGPDLWTGVLLALAWGLVGGAVGGLIRGGLKDRTTAPQATVGGGTRPPAPAPPAPG
jgi:hypothetical protein